MGIKSKSGSTAASDPTANDSVYDFLYHDARRVGSFLAQLDPNGHLQALKRTQRRDRGTASKDSVAPSLGFPGLASLGGTSEDSASEDNSLGDERSFDPLWANARAFLDLLHQKGLIVRNMHDAAVGQFTLTTGTLKVVNPGILRPIWDNAEIISAFIAQSDGQINQQMALLLEVMKGLPHSAQCQFFGEQMLTRDVSRFSILDNPVGETITSGAAWMMLDPAALIVTPVELMMKYGAWVGSWNVLCIKDTDADDGPVLDADLSADLSEDPMAAAKDRNSTVMAVFSESIAPLGRMLMGRPAKFYGATPLLIFREVAVAQ